MANEFWLNGSGELRCSGDSPKDRLEALRLSIMKWQTIVDLLKDGKTINDDGGNDTCGCCMLFYWGECYGCPIAEHTGLEACDGTPYEQLRFGDFELEGAQRELEFLQELLSKEEGK